MVMNENEWDLQGKGVDLLSDACLSDGTYILFTHLGLCYMFLGVSQIADLFMEAIEVITSTTSVRVVKTSSGEYKEVEVQVWNETVANLTLMALGSSAPEILLSVIEICGNNFKAGDLGPGTIVGSAAFNLFVITALCVSVIPDGTGKSVKNFGVFACTASWSIGAYVWLYLMIAVITKEKVRANHSCKIAPYSLGSQVETGRLSCDRFPHSSDKITNFWFRIR